MGQLVCYLCSEGKYTHKSVEEETHFPHSRMTSWGGFERTLSSATICSDDKVHAHHDLEPMVFRANWIGQVKNWLLGQVQVGVEELCQQSLWRGAPVQWDRGWREASSHKGSHPPASPIPRTYLGQQHINLCDYVPIQFRSIKQPHFVAPTVVFLWQLQVWLWTLQRSQAKKRQKNGMNKHGGMPW